MSLMEVRQGLLQRHRDVECDGHVPIVGTGHRSDLAIEELMALGLGGFPGEVVGGGHRRGLAGCPIGWLQGGAAGEAGRMVADPVPIDSMGSRSSGACVGTQRKESGELHPD